MCLQLENELQASQIYNQGWNLGSPTRFLNIILLSPASPSPNLTFSSTIHECYGAYELQVHCVIVDHFINFGI